MLRVVGLGNLAVKKPAPQPPDLISVEIAQRIAHPRRIRCCVRCQTVARERIDDFGLVGILHAQRIAPGFCTLSDEP